MVDAFDRLVERLHRDAVRFVVIGFSGANYYARSARMLFATQDRDLFLPPDADNTLAAWRACEALDLATDRAGLDVDFTFVMAGQDFERVWKRRRIFRLGNVELPVARLADIVESKRRAGRDKDRLFLTTHADALRDLMEVERRGPVRSKRAPRKTPR